MRDFNEADKRKKQARKEVPENPAGLSDTVLSYLTDKVKISLHEGALPCGTAFKISLDAGVPRIAVGEIADRLGVRVTNCQLGCFKVDKTIHDERGIEIAEEGVLSEVEKLIKEDALTCTMVFALAKQLKKPPMAVASVANARNLKIRECQLGCF